MQPVDPSLLPPSLARFLDLWNAKRGGRRMPARRDFSHEELWPWMGLLNLIAVEGEEARFVVFSETSARVYGREMTGKTMRQFEPAPLAAAATEAHRALMAGGGVPMFMRVVGPFDNRELQWTRLATPLSGDGRHIDRYFVALHFDEIRLAAPTGIYALKGAPIR
jgi:hypothetical protein